MVVFVTGGSGQGKSEFAEKIATHFGGKLIYVATMPIFSKEDEQKVERHHKLRAGKGFETLERPKLLEAIPSQDETVLIECISTHTANVIFDPEIQPSEDERFLNSPDTSEAAIKTEAYIQFIKEEMEPLLNRKGHTIFVSAEVAQDGTVYDDETECYKAVLTEINKWLAEKADAAYEVVCGIPVSIKGDLRV